MNDSISREKAIDLVKDVCNEIMSGCGSHYDEEMGDEVYDDISEINAILTCNKKIRKALKELPHAQEIIRCKDCKYRDKNWRRVSVRWLPCMEVQTGSNWYCGSAERGEQDGRDN